MTVKEKSFSSPLVGTHKAGICALHHTFSPPADNLSNFSLVLLDYLYCIVNAMHFNTVSVPALQLFDRIFLGTLN